MVQHSLEESVGKEAAAAVEGGQVPDDAAAIAAGCDTLLTAAGLHLDAVHCTLVLLHNNTADSCEHAHLGVSAGHPTELQGAGGPPTKEGGGVGCGVGS